MKKVAGVISMRLRDIKEELIEVLEADRGRLARRRVRVRAARAGQRAARALSPLDSGADAALALNVRIVSYMSAM